MFNNEKGVLPDGVRYREAGDLFDFGYALTVHKAQGSEFDRVFIFGTGFGEWRNQWLYTAITRAKKELYICCDKI
jgi:exodeoxyribonuclease-5